MRLLLLTEFPYAFSTFRLTLENLASRYRAQGHSVRTTGRGERGFPPKSTDAGLIHLHTAGLWNSALDRIADVCSGKPLVVTFQDWDNPDLPKNDARARRRWNRLLGGARAVTAVSRATAARMADALRLTTSVQTVPNGIEDVFFRSVGKRSPTRSYILCPARLSAYKGIDIALLAWRDASTQLRDVEFVFAGPDHSDGRFQRLARILGLGRSTRFVGAVGRSEMADLMAGSLFTVLPSRHESFGVAALEAMAMGKAVVATRTDGPRDLVADGKTGLLVSISDPGALRDALLLLGRDPERRRSMGRAARDAARQYGWNQVARRYLSVYREALKP